MNEPPKRFGDRVLAGDFLGSSDFRSAVDPASTQSGSRSGSGRLAALSESSRLSLLRRVAALRKSDRLEACLERSPPERYAQWARDGAQDAKHLILLTETGDTLSEPDPAR